MLATRASRWPRALVRAPNPCRELVTSQPSPGHSPTLCEQPDHPALFACARAAKRRQQSIERRFGDSPQKSSLVASADLSAAGVGKTFSYGWAAFPPAGLKGEGAEVMGITGEDLHAAQIRGPNNARISSAKLYANNGK